MSPVRKFTKYIRGKNTFLKKDSFEVLKKPAQFSNGASKGFTLLEFVLYIGIVGIVLLVAGAIGLNVLFGKAKLMAVEEVSQSARFALERMSERIRSAKAIVNPLPGAAAAALSLEFADADKNPTVFDAAAGILRIKEGLGAPIPLTANEVSITDLQFSNISYPNTPGTLRVELRLKLVNPENRQEYNFEKTFYTTANIRKK